MDLDVQSIADGLQGVDPGIGPAPDIADGVGAACGAHGESAIRDTSSVNQTQKLLPDLHAVSIPLLSEKRREARAI